MKCESTINGKSCELNHGHEHAHQSGPFKWHNSQSKIQGFKPLFTVPEREGSQDFYSTGEVPRDYKCSKCKAHGCKMWRPANSFNIELMCGDCALEDQKEPGPIDPDGKCPSKGLDGMKTDQIGWMLPAVPSETEDSYWGYTSVPQPGVDWWRNLPNRV